MYFFAKIMKYFTIIFVLIVLVSCHKQGNVTQISGKPIGVPKSPDCLSNFQYQEIVIPSSELQKIAQKIYQNECAGKSDLECR